MDQDIEIINAKTRNEKIKNFFVNNRKILISIIALVVTILMGYFLYTHFQENKKIKLANRYNLAIDKNNSGEKSSVTNELIYIIKEQDKTYSPLALYYLMDNGLISSKDEINQYFDIIINQINLDKEIKNLIIYKKGLFNSDFETESELLTILNPLINSESIWKSHALYLMAEYFYSKGEKQKSLEFYNQIVSLEKSNPNIKLEAEKRIRRDLSE
tara:strand:- start:2313 stop:2957 length:645 start_codon:yes stop_codon:yes gene_type:complete